MESNESVDRWLSEVSAEAVKRSGMSESEANDAADCFERLAAHGSGTIVLNQTDFQSLLEKLTSDAKGRRLLEVMLLKKKTIQSMTPMRVRQPAN